MIVFYFQCLAPTFKSLVIVQVHFNESFEVETGNMVNGTVMREGGR